MTGQALCGERWPKFRQLSSALHWDWYLYRKLERVAHSAHKWKSSSHNYCRARFQPSGHFGSISYQAIVFHTWNYLHSLESFAKKAARLADCVLKQWLDEIETKQIETKQQTKKSSNAVELEIAKVNFDSLRYLIICQNNEFLIMCPNLLQITLNLIHNIFNLAKFGCL